MNRCQATFSVFFTLTHASFKPQNILSSTVIVLCQASKASARRCGHLNVTAAILGGRMRMPQLKQNGPKKRRNIQILFIFLKKTKKKSCYCEFCFILYFYTDHKYDRPTTGEHVFVNLFCSGIGLVCTVRWCTVIGLRSR